MTIGDAMMPDEADALVTLPLASRMTEASNPDSAEIDIVDTAAVLAIINNEDRKVANAVSEALPAIQMAVEAIVDGWSAGGRLFYIGAGTSGRLGVLDASECPPTFGVSPDLVQGVIAGGDVALRSSVEAAEDSPDAGASEMVRLGVGKSDVVVGLAAREQHLMLSARCVKPGLVGRSRLAFAATTMRRFPAQSTSQSR